MFEQGCEIDGLFKVNQDLILSEFIVEDIYSNLM